MEFNFDFEMTKENKKMIEELLKQKGIKHYVIETKNKEKIDLVEYKNYQELEQENEQLKEEKRLILKDISFWIRNSKVEQIEGDMVHQRYWMCFEDIVNNIFKKYNTENLSDKDLKYNHYLEKENEEIIKEIQQKEDIINKARELLVKWGEEPDADMYMQIKEYKEHRELLEILDNKGE